MNKIIYADPEGDEVLDPKTGSLKAAVLELPSNYWGRGSGDATLSLTKPDGCEVSLLLLPNPQLSRIYLKCLIMKSGIVEEEWLSLRDQSQLSVVTTCSDEWLASEGLFLEPQDAWVAVECFLETGERTDKVNWITPDRIPEDGNW
jgi:hypothetical protein